MPAQRTDKQFRRELKATGLRVKVIEPYVRYRRPLLTVCLVCEKQWKAKPEYLLQGHGCSRCGNAEKKTHAQYRTALSDRFGAKVIALERYVNTDTKIHHRCGCGNVFAKSPYEMLRARHPCARCYHMSRAPSDLSGYKAFKREVTILTRRSYLDHVALINPKGLRRSKHLHLDHCYSTREAYTNPKRLKRPVTAKEVAHPANLRLLHGRTNIVKYSYSEITASELRRRIREFNRRLKFQKGLR